ncbi:helix-turn-helix transcriptional regulator [Arthrobacter sp. HLT1-20]
MGNANQPTENELLKPEEAAGLLRTTKATLAGLRHTGGGPRYVKFGRAVLYRRSDIETYLNENLFSRTDTAVAK